MHLYLRADGDTLTGLGHLMRCFALAQSWCDSGGKATLITFCDNNDILQQLKNEDFNVYNISHTYPHEDDINDTLRIISSHQNPWIVIDGYNFDEMYHRKLKSVANHLLVIDDLAQLSHYQADIVLNQNLHAEQLHYSCEFNTRLLLGTRYVIIRKQFLDWINWRREVPKVARKILITLGGTDKDNHTLKIINALERTSIAELEAIIVVGVNNPHASTLKEAVGTSSIKIHLSHNPQNLPELMAWADITICTAGVTLLEMLFLGVPVLALTLAENQMPNAQELDRQGIGRSLGWAYNISIELMAKAIEDLIIDADTRKMMSKKARKLVDGLGAQRVVKIMQGSKV